MIKDFTVTEGIILKSQAGIINGALTYTPTATGDGIWLTGLYAHATDTYVDGTGASGSGNGWRVGAKTAALNCNSFKLVNCYGSYMGGHGLYIHDAIGAGGTLSLPDANAGTVIGFSALNNAGDGIRVGNAILNTFVGCHAEQNTGRGIYFEGVSGGRCHSNTVIGGDFEANAIKDIMFSANTTMNTLLMSPNFSSFLTDSGFNNYILPNQTYSSGTFTPGLYSTGQATSTLTFVQNTAGTVSFTTSTAHGLAVGDYVFISSTVAGSAVNGVFVCLAGTAGSTINITIRPNLDNPSNPVPTSSTACGGTARRCLPMSSALGNFSITGNVVTFTVNLAVSSLAGVTAGNIMFVPPFPPKNLSSLNVMTHVPYAINTTGLTTANGVMAVNLVQDGSLIGKSLFRDIGFGLTATALTDAKITATFTIMFTGTFVI